MTTGAASTPTESQPPLDGLRVLELSTGVAGPYAGRLLAMLGAEVVKIEPEGGDPARSMAVDGQSPVGTSPLFLHLNAGKSNVASSSAAELATSWAEVVLDDRVRSQVEGSDTDLTALSDGGPLVVSTTAWGFEAADAGQPSDEILVQAASGITAFNCDPDGPPMRLPGWQSQYIAGGLAAVAALGALRTGTRHVDVSWLGGFLTSIELTYADALHCQRERQPVGPNPPSAFPSGALPCKDGFVSPGTIRAIDWEMTCLIQGHPELVGERRFSNRQQRVEHVDEIWDLFKDWYAERTKREIFQYALDTPWAVGMVMKPTEALADEHLEARGYLADIDTPEGSVRMAHRPWRAAGLPVAGQTVSAVGADPAPGAASADDAPERAPLAGTRLIEMTVAWAGPYVGNLLAPLGVDVLKIEAENPFDGWRALRPYDHGMPPGHEQLVHDNRWFDASGLFNGLNRGKRSTILSLRSDEGRDAFLDLVANADGIVANFSAHVLPNLGLDWETLRTVNPKLVVIRMPALGVEGPYNSVAGYGSIIEAMGGIGHRQGYAHESARISNVYYPDPIAGIHAALAFMTGLERRDRTGEGGEVDLSHQDVTWLHHGEALVLAGQEGRDIGRMGNEEPGVAASGFWKGTDGRWVAIVAGQADEPAGQRAAAKAFMSEASTLTSTELMLAAQAQGWGAELVTSPWDAPDGDRVGPHLETIDHPVTGPIRHIASPYRLDGVRPASRGPAPTFDQHTDEVFAQVAGYDEATIADLRERKIIGGALPEPASMGYRFEV